MRVFDTLNSYYNDLSLHELRLMNDNTIYPNISYNSLLYMDLIACRPNCTVSSIAETLRISKSAVTVKVNELIRQGFVVKTQSEKDKRVYYLALSEAVAQDYAKYDVMLGRAVEALEKKYSPGQLDTFCDMLDLVKTVYLEEPG